MTEVRFDSPRLHQTVFLYGFFILKCFAIKTTMIEEKCFVFL